MGLGESRGVPVADVVHGIDPGEAGVKSGAIVLEGGWGGAHVLLSGSGGRGGLGCQDRGGRGQCLSEVTGREPTR